MCSRAWGIGTCGVIVHSGLRLCILEREEGDGEGWQRWVLLQWDSHCWFKMKEPGQSITLNDCRRGSMLGASWSLRRLIRSQVHWVIVWFPRQLTPQSRFCFTGTLKECSEALSTCLSDQNNHDYVIDNSKPDNMQNFAEHKQCDRQTTCLLFSALLAVSLHENCRPCAHAWVEGQKQSLNVLLWHFDEAMKPFSKSNSDKCNHQIW